MFHLTISFVDQVGLQEYFVAQLEVKQSVSGCLSLELVDSKLKLDRCLKVEGFQEMFGNSSNYHLET